MVSKTSQGFEVDREYRALEDFVVNNPELEQLETLLGQFNIFEAVGAVRQELRHTDFLAYLLNPRQNHGIGDFFTKRFIQKAIMSRKESAPPVSLIDLDFWELEETMVHREWNDVDIVLENRSHRFAVIIENKIDSTEHSEQLQRYRATADRHYRGWKLLYLYLTPEGETPSDESYVPIDYRLICSLIEDLVSVRASTLGPEVKTLATHYCQMIRRHIVRESAIEDLCQKIYHKHQAALELLFEYRPDLQTSLKEHLEQLIQGNPELVLDHCSKSYVRFIPKKWDASSLRKGEKWTPSKRMLLCEFRNSSDRLSLALIIGPGPQDIRQKLFDMAQLDGKLLKPSSKSITGSFCTIFTREFLHHKDYDRASLEDLKPKIDGAWRSFAEHDLPKIDAVLFNQSWLWANQGEE